MIGSLLPHTQLIVRSSELYANPVIQSGATCSTFPVPYRRTNHSTIVRAEIRVRGQLTSNLDPVYTGSRERQPTPERYTLQYKTYTFDLVLVLFHPNSFPVSSLIVFSHPFKRHVFTKELVNHVTEDTISRRIMIM
ncbi:MAG: hypothetical protein HC906_14680 [Bacteroidales bacterium]|nr:hypothetical protein [Bacteroidales bacterium]